MSLLAERLAPALAVWPYWLAVSCLVSIGLTPVARTLARRYGFVAQPKQDRWHTKPTALMGGVAVVSAVLAVMPFVGASIGVLQVLGSGAFLFLVGLVDDVMGMRPATKLVLQIVAASALVFWGHSVQWTGSLTADSLLTILWVVAITNAFNLLDNMDGLCAGIGVISCLALVLSHPVEWSSDAALLAAVLAGSLIGFLFYNFRPATIFLGDSGSLFVGVILAGLTLQGHTSAPGQSAVTVLIVPVLILLIPICDTALVTIVRKLSGRAASQGGTDHLSHRLVALGFSERTAVLILYGLAAASGAGASLVNRFGFERAGLAVALFLIGMLLFGVALARVRVYADEDFAALKGQAYTPVLTDLTYKRRVFEVLLDFLIIGVASYGAYRLKYDGDEFGLEFPNFIRALPVVIIVQSASFWIGGVYRGVWRYVSLADLTVYLRSVALGTVGVFVATAIMYGGARPSLTVFVIQAMLLFMMLFGSRLSFRAIGEAGRRHRRANGKRVLIYGAGDAGLLLLREILNNRDHQYHPVAFMDDDPLKAGRTIHGYPVAGRLEDMPKLIKQLDIEVVLLSTQRLSAQKEREVEAMCLSSGIDLVRLQLQLQKHTAASPSATSSATSPTASIDVH